VTLVTWAVAVVAVALAATGALKVVDPRSSGPMLAALGLPHSPGAARIVGLGELAVGLGVLLTPWRGPLGALALVFAGLTIAVTVVRRRHPSTPCGCVGRWSGPPTQRHVAVNAVAVLVACVGLAAADPLPVTEGTSVVWWLAVMVGSVAMLGLLAAGGRQSVAMGVMSRGRKSSG